MLYIVLQTKTEDDVAKFAKKLTDALEKESFACNSRSEGKTVIIRVTGLAKAK